MRYQLIASLLALTLSACGALAKPHNDVLIFGTTTKLGVDVSAPVQNGALPEFSVGYKRNEGVWMPLKSNGDDALLMGDPAIQRRFSECLKRFEGDIPVEGERRRYCAAIALPTNKYLAWSEGIDKGKGGASGETDTYSVFASFGGRGSLGFNSASGSMAQFFATGIAAQRLGANPAVAAALNADGPQALGKQADAEKAKAEADLSPSKIAYDKQVDATTKLAAEWKSCADPASDKANFVKAVDEAATIVPDEGFWTFLKSQTSKQDATKLISNVKTTDGIEAFRQGRTKICGSN